MTGISQFFKGLFELVELIDEISTMKIFKNQGWHFISLVILLFLISKTVQSNPDFLIGEFAGKPTEFWLKWAIAIPVLHQIYVWICWRLELHYKGLSKFLGKNAFLIYVVGFFVLILSRPIFLIFLGESNAHSFSLNPTLKYALIVLFLIPSLWTLYSVKKYFGMFRAAGQDHFDPEISKLPFVKKGIFKYTNNAMYTFAFLILYAIGLWYESLAVLLGAAFNHVYIWVHYYCTELPDIQEIYGEK